ncbi:MAG: C25 family cysteine peptidase [Candidatus Electryonea clarkiae]|nr:C25 family cysteine peptidase [Candidatus Electryonea clarkiae]MDP8288575.1 C25 family cysteine peptidase [Candidatus Electryonea clarkiae]
MRIVTVVLVVLMLTAVVFAGNLQRSFTFGSLELIENDGYTLARMEGVPSIGEPGMPVLPTKDHILVLPPGEELVEIQVLNAQWVDVPGRFIPEPGSQPVPISQMKYMPLVPDPSVYQGNNVFPANIVSDLQTGFLRGYSIGTFLVHPVRWDPITQTAQRLESIDLELVTQTTQRAENASRFLRGGKNTDQILSSMTDDISSAQQYNAELDELDELDPKLLIICAPAHEIYWEEYAEFKRMRGIETAIYTTTGDIYPNYDGVDNAEKVRNAIIEAYDEYDIEFVIMGGDVAYVPYRGLYAEASGETDNLPSDLYFAGLDGSWNNDNDNRWGEPAEADLFQEITVGRAPVSTSGMIESWIDKMILYQTEPVVDQVTEALMAGEDLGWEAWGGDYQDEVAEGSNNYGYTTVGFPDEWHVDTIYDREAVWSWSQLFDRLNNGAHFVSHLGHANVTYGLKATNNNISDLTLTNDGEENSRYLIYTQGCFCGAFEQNSIMEKWNTVYNGAFAVLSNSRFGWGNSGDTNGPSQRYNRQFFDAIFGENISLVGGVNRDSKHDNSANINGSCMRWCYYEINLFGDPSLDLFTDTPEELAVELPEYYSLGNPYLTLSADGEAWARVVLIYDEEVIRVGQTDARGNANIPLELDNPGDLTVTIIAHNKLPFTSTVQVIAAEGPFPTVAECIVADDVSGNGNGMADFGEEIVLEMDIVNLGQDAISSMTMTFESLSSALSLDDEEMTIEDLEPGGNIIVECAANIDVDVIDMTNATVLVNFVSDDGEGEWEREVFVRLHAPRLYLNVGIANDEDDGNGNHRIDPGETSTMVVSIRNEGSADLSDASLEVFSDNPYISDVALSEDLVTVPANEAIDFEAAYTITIDDDAPDPYRATVLMRIEKENGYLFRAVDLIEIGGIYEDVDGNEQPLTHYANGGDDQWHITTEKNWTHNGTRSWKCGDAMGGDSGDNLDGCLQLPGVPRDVPVTLSFRHWMEAEISVQHGGECYDGGRVEVTVDQENWIVVPMDGYNYTTRGNGTFGEGNRIYSGAIDWEEQSYTFQTGEGDSLWIRFRYVTDTDVQNQDVLEGWYLDNISISLGQSLTPPHTLEADVIENEITRLTWMTPNPELDEDLQLLGFKVFRDDEAITGPVPDVTYDDDMLQLEPGTYIYKVAAVYERGESVPTEEIEIAWEGNKAKENPLPATWSFEPPYPNPFNPVATVRVAVPEISVIKLTVYDLLGREVLQLIDGRVEAGYHQFAIDGSSWASGMYFVALNTPERSAIHKMILMK